MELIEFRQIASVELNDRYVVYSFLVCIFFTVQFGEVLQARIIFFAETIQFC